MSLFISICTDMAALRESGAVDEDSPYRGLIEGRSGAYVQYSTDGTQSMVGLTSIDGLEPIAEFSYITVTSYEEIFGHWRQVEDEEGEPQFEITFVTEQLAYQVRVEDGPEYTVMTPEKQITPGWEVEQVQNRNEDPDDDIPDGQFEDGFHDEWTFTGTPETDDDGNEMYPPKYTMVEVPLLDEDGNEVTASDPQFEIRYEDAERKVTTPVREWVDGDAELKSLYDSIYDQSPVTDEDGNVTTPSELFYVPAGHSVANILES
jgi:hypothetical protein